MKITKKPLFMALFAAIGLNGCANTSAPAVNEQYSEPLLIGTSVEQKILDAANEVKGQLALLVKLEKGEDVGPAQTVAHNQNLDARSVSEKPGSQYNVNNEQGGVKDGMNAGLNAGFNTPEWSRRVNIKWKNNGLDLLLSKIAQAVEYSFNVQAQPGVVMRKVDMSFEAESLSEVIKKISINVDDFADVSISHKNKSITLIYRQK